LAAPASGLVLPRPLPEVVPEPEQASSTEYPEPAMLGAVLGWQKNGQKADDEMSAQHPQQRDSADLALAQHSLTSEERFTALDEQRAQKTLQKAKAQLLLEIKKRAREVSPLQEKPLPAVDNEVPSFISQQPQVPITADKGRFANVQQAARFDRHHTDKLEQRRQLVDIQEQERVQRLQQRQQDMVQISPDSRRAIELSVARSGSTLLLNVFSIIEDAFVLPEPYNMFDVNVTLPRHMDPSAEPPRPEELLDCEFTNGLAFGHVFWDYACHNIQWIIKDPAKLLACSQGRLQRKFVEDKCKKAPLNLLKVIRAPFMIKNFGRPEVIPRDIKVFNLVRAPWDIFMSQYLAGWFTDPQQFFRSMMPKGADMNAFNMDRICNQMLLNHEVTLDRPAENAFILRYEDLLQDFDGWITQLFAFLDIPVDEKLLTLASRVRLRKYADFVKIPSSRVAFDKDKAKELAISIPSCQAVLQMFHYG
jgi:hypothetical protein